MASNTIKGLVALGVKLTGSLSDSILSIIKTLTSVLHFILFDFILVIELIESLTIINIEYILF